MNALPLPEQRTVVLGGTGSVGEHMVRAHLRAGAEVVVPSRTEGRARSLREDAVVSSAGSALRLVVGDYTTFASARRSAEAITADFGSVDNVVATLGSWWSGAPMWDVSEDTWQRYFVDVATAYAAAARAWLPLLPSGGSLQFVLGASGVVPVPGASIISAAQSGLVMLRRVIAEEAGAQRRVFSIVLGNLNLRRRPGSRPDFVHADTAAEVSVRLAAGTLPSAELVMRTPEQGAAVLARVGGDTAGATPRGEARQ